MKKVTFASATLANTDDARWLRWLDAEVFPDDTPFPFVHVRAFLGSHDGQPVAYCAWKPILQGADVCGYHYRAGVMTKFRGAGLQGKMLALRERDMRSQKITTAITNTHSDNAPSMRSLINAGYRPYVPTEVTRLTTGPFVHWRKQL